MTDYVDGKVAWLAEGLPAEGRIDDGERIGSRVSPPTDGVPLDVAGDPWTVRPNELVRDVRDRLRDRGEGAPEVVYVTTARGRLLGVIDPTSLRATHAR